MTSSEETIRDARDAAAIANRAYQFAELEIKRLDQLRAADQLAVAAALAAAEKAVAAAATSSEKAINKAEEAQLRVNSTQNEFRGSLDDQGKNMMPRTETENLIRELRGLISDRGAEIAELRSRLDVGPAALQTLQTRSDENVGRRAGAIDGRTLGLAVIGLVLSFIVVGLAVFAALAK